MYESPGGNAAGSDAELLNAIRSGHAGSYELLRARHAAAARSLAGHIELPPSAAGDAVEEAFSRVLDALRMGGGPTDAFRPYLLTAVRRAADDRTGHDGNEDPATEHQITGPGELEPGTATGGPDAGAAVGAFLSLPERWRAVLWHISIEGADPADAARLLGLPPEDADEIADQARDGFARAYLDQTGEDSARTDLGGIDTLLRSTVAPVVLGDAAAAYLADGAGHPGGLGRPGPATISTATDPTGFRAIAVPVIPGMGTAGGTAAGGTAAGSTAAGSTAAGSTAAGGPTVTAPTPTAWSVVGGAAGAALSAGAAADAAAGASRTARAGAGSAAFLGAGPPLPADVHGGAAGGGAGGGATGLRAGWQRSSPRQRGITAAACALLATGAVAGILLALGTGSSPATKAAGDPTGLIAPTAAPSPAATPGQPKAKTKPPATARHHRHRAHHQHHAGPVTPPTQGPPSHGPAPQPQPRRHPVASVAAHVNVIGPVGNSYSAEVTFGVTASGGSRTRGLTAQINLPTGSALALGLGVAGGNGWTCSATGHGALCVHQPVRAGSRASGGMYVVIMRTAACDRPVGITVTGGRAPSGAQSPRGFSCVDPGRPGHHHR